ncbi:hypothetical protein K7X08_019174 [Anisodus acutangulus]|uniref:Helicase ATP-binding domain-containing protein n=1 Tax=Anisodus acutangulus TaxID=402998 RepID=A0A9Q1MRY8_9SOLA|nr:hypothetical protein K7X08_019174 [Anisodus acutangulus]
MHFEASLEIYVAPSKALVQERLRSWNQKLGSWGINCLELTGDNEYYKITDIQDADVILTTPEKFDAVTRYRIKDGGLSFFGDIALVLIDEVHLLNDPRGAALEAIVSRIKMLSRKPGLKSSALANVRFLAVSATIPNIDDLEHLTAEIVQLTVSDITGAIEWMKCSFLYNPEKYAVRKGLTGDRLERHMQDICVQNVNELSRYQLIWTDEDGFLLKPLEPGKLMTKYYLNFDTMKHTIQASGTDMNSICANGYRIAKCMKEYFLYRKNYRGALSSAHLTKSLYQKVWDDSPYVLKQLPGIGMVTAKALHSMGIKSFASFSEADPRKIEMVPGRKYPFGNHIKESLLSLPPEVEMRFEEIERQRQGKSKVMVVGVEEDNLVLFHEKIRVDDFPRPYSKTVVVPSPQQGKLTVKADLIFDEFIGIDLHQKVVLIKEIDLNFVMKYRTKQPSSFQNNDVCITEDTEDAAQASCQVSHSLTEADRSSDMASFKLIDEDLDEVIPAAAIEDDECRIINEKTIFDHIREKAKNLPSLTSLKGTCSPSLETLNLIRKRTRENAVGVSEEVKRTKVPCHGMVIQSTEHIDLEDNRPFSNKDERPYSHHVSNAIYLASDTGNFSFETGSVPSETMAEEMIFEYKPMDSKMFHSFENVKNTEHKLLSIANENCIIHQPQHNSAIFGFQETTPTKVAENASVIMDLEPVKTKENAIIQIKEVEDLALHGYTPGTSEKPDLSLETSRKDAEERSRLLSPADAYFITKKVGYSLCSPSLQEQQGTSSVQVGKISQANPFLGFKSIFTFLFE